MVSVSSYEIAYTMTPPRMKGSVIAVVFFTSAISQVIIEAATPAFNDPYLIWPFVAIAIANFLAAIFNYFLFHRMEDRENTNLHRMDLTEKEIIAMEGKA